MGSWSNTGAALRRLVLQVGLPKYALPSDSNSAGDECALLKSLFIGIQRKQKTALKMVL